MESSSNKVVAAVLGVLALLCVALVAVFGPSFLERYYLGRLSRDAEFFSTTLTTESDGLLARAVERFLETEGGKSKLFELFYSAVVEKYPWLPGQFRDGLHGVIQFEPDGKISWTMRIPKNARWNNQVPTDRLRALQRHLGAIQGFEFGLAEHPGWRFVLCGDKPVKVYRVRPVRRTRSGSRPTSR